MISIEKPAADSIEIETPSATQSVSQTQFSKEENAFYSVYAKCGNDKSEKESGGVDGIETQTDSKNVFRADIGENKTLFYPDDAEDGKRMGGSEESFESLFERFWLYHIGTHNGWWANEKKRNRSRNFQILDALAGRLELTNFQIRRVKHLMKIEVSDFRRYNIGHSNVIELALIALCAYVAKKDGRNCHPNCPNDDELFAHVKSRFDIEAHEFRKVYGRLEWDLTNRK